MNRRLSYKAILFSVSFFLFTACTRQVTFNTYRPASINVPARVKTLLVLDRTEFENQKANIIEGIFTGEGIGEDRNGVDEAINSFQQTLLQSPRFQVVKATERYFGNSLTGTFPVALTWNKITALCNKYKTDAVVALEIFDTNFIVTDAKKNVTRTVERDGQKKEIQVTEFYVQGVATAKVGFRIYDPKENSVADQQLFSESYTWKAQASTLQEAYAKLVQKTEATRYTSRMAGNSYAQKIAPMPMRISRTFYAKPKRNHYLTAGTRRAEVNQWEKAIETWKKGLGFTDPKVSGKISYNIAIGYEVLGDLKSAKEWADKSYVNYGNKKAREYSAMLNYRMNDEELVKQQMQ